MKARVLFGVIGFIFVLLALYVLPPVVLAVAITTLGCVAAYELPHPTGLVKRHAGAAEHMLTAAMITCDGAIECRFSAGISKNGMLSFCDACRAVFLLRFFALLLRDHDSVTMQTRLWPDFSAA